MLLVKLTVTPVLMWLVSLVGRRWGGLAAGTASGLPLTSGPISIYLALEQGAPFARAAAGAGLSGTGAVFASFVAYVAASGRLGMMRAAACGLFAYAVVAILSYLAGSDIVPCFVGLIGWALVLRMPAAAPDLTEPGRRSPLDLAARIGVSTILVLSVTAFAHHLGPGPSGLIAPIPVIAWPLLVFEHVQQGRAGAIAVAKGVVTGMLGVLAFYVVIARFLVPGDLLQVYLLAFALALLVSAAAVALLKYGPLGFDPTKRGATLSPLDRP